MPPLGTTSMQAAPAGAPVSQGPGMSPFSPSGLPDTMRAMSMMFQAGRMLAQANPDLAAFISQFLTQLQVAIPQTAMAGMDPMAAMQGGGQMGMQGGPMGGPAPQQGLTPPPTPMPL